MPFEGAQLHTVCSARPLPKFLDKLFECHVLHRPTKPHEQNKFTK